MDHEDLRFPNRSFSSKFELNLNRDNVRVSFESSFQDELAMAVLDLSAGEVVSFGDIAAAAGRPAASRAAGRMLSKSMDTLPWWRVVYSDGRLPPCNPSLQAERLADEGVTVVGFRVTRSPRGRFAKMDQDSDSAS